MVLVEDILKEICAAIPDVDREKATELAQHLTSDAVGVRSMNRLYDVSKEDMAILPNCDAMRLYRIWQKKYKPEAVAHRSLQEIPASSFQIDWTKVDKETKDLLEAQKRLPKKNRCRLVTCIVQDVLAKKHNVNRAYFKGIAADMVKKYPESLQDLYKESRPLECKFLTKKLSCKYDEEKRVKQKKEFVEAPNIPQAYGCVQWRVKDFPSGETRESLENKKKQLKEMFSEQRRSEWSWTTILNLMKLTYKLQREDINSQTAPRKRNQPEPARKTTEEIAGDWPFLFQVKGMNQHFTQLTGVNLVSNFEAFETRVDRDHFIQFLVSYKEDKNRTIKKKYERAIKNDTCPNPHVIAILLMLVNCFNESLEKVVIEIESTTNIQEVSDVIDVPATPCIISLGRVFKAKKFYFSIDGRVHSSMKSFWEALFILFQSYFVFNIKYPQDIGNTMEFYQRVVAQIAPERGSKTKKKNYRSNEGEKLQTLIEAYEANSTSSEDETDEMDVDDVEVS